MTINCGHCGQTHPSVQAVRECAQTAPVCTCGGDPATDGAILIHSFQCPLKGASARAFTEQDERDMQRMEAEGDRTETYREERAKAGRKASVETWYKPATATEEGLYRLSRTVVVHGQIYQSGALFQCLLGKDSGRLYAKLVEFPKDGAKKRPTLTYVGSMIYQILESELVPAEEVQELTKNTGWCVFGHFLTNPESVKRGMGPTCYARYPHLAKNAVAS